MDQHWQPGGDTNSPVPPDTSVFVDNLPGAEPMLAANGINTGIQPGNIKDLWEEGTIRLESLKITANFIKEIRNATLDNLNLGLSDVAIDWLRHPTHKLPGHSIDDDLCTAIKLFLGNPSEATYETNRSIILDCVPGANIPTYYRAGRIIAEMTGIESVLHDMCINSCVAFTGPFLTLNKCPLCNEPRYDQFWLQSTHGKEKVPRQEFHTIPIGPQLQALYREPGSATVAHYLWDERSRVLSAIEENGCPDKYSDVLHGSDLVEAFHDGCIAEDDIVLMFSVDGAQLYAKKASACWIYIWVLFNISPDR